VPGADEQPADRETDGAEKASGGPESPGGADRGGAAEAGAAGDASAAGRAEEYLQSLQRITADFANYRRRTAAEQSRWREAGVAAFALQMLPVVDNLERAVAAAGDGATVRQGVEMTLRQLREVFEGSGIRRMAAVGESFDPGRHEAVAGEPEGVVAEEYRAGYLFREQVLRPAMVRVGPAAEQGRPPKGAPPAEGAAAGEAGAADRGAEQTGKEGDR
jgi:molecular chaperone GrpE